MEILSREEIRVDANWLLVVYLMRDAWGRLHHDQVELYRPLKEWSRK